MQSEEAHERMTDMAKRSEFHRAREFRLRSLVLGQARVTGLKCRFEALRPVLRFVVEEPRSGI